LGLLLGIAASVAAPVAFGAAAVAPPVDIAAPTTLTGPIVATFGSPTSGITPRRVTLRRVGGSLFRHVSRAATRMGGPSTAPPALL
jgi:hypothetical protein